MIEAVYSAKPYKRDSRGDWWNGAVIGMEADRWYRIIGSHYDVVLNGPKKWVVRWAGEDGKEFMLTYSLDKEQRFVADYPGHGSGFIAGEAV